MNDKTRYTKTSLQGRKDYLIRKKLALERATEEMNVSEMGVLEVQINWAKLEIAKKELNYGSNT